MPLQRDHDKINFIFQHGWGFSASVWNDWIQYLETDYYQFLDRGYFGKEIEPQMADCVNVLISHSLGLHLCEPWLANIDCLIIISGFEHFHGLDKAAGRFSRRHVKRMLARLDTDTQGLLHDFYNDCQYPLSPPAIYAFNQSLLRKDLNLLDSNFVDINRLQEFERILILHGRNDKIVSPDRALELQRKLPNSVIEFIDDAGHGLPFTHSLACWQLISNFCQK